MSLNSKIKYSAATLSIVTVAFLSKPALADQVIQNDLIVQYNVCVGHDCINGENFGFTSLKLKSPNVVLEFDDTSNSSSFPSNDWKIIVNENQNGGLNKFAIQDATAGRDQFTIMAGVPANSLFIGGGSQQAKIGFGTNHPDADLHLFSHNTPQIRLEQGHVFGFTPHVWDIGANETNFFIRDTTSKGALPFRIKPGAATDSLNIEEDGKVTILSSLSVPELSTDSLNLSTLSVPELESTSLAINSGDQNAQIALHQSGKLPTSWLIRNYAKNGNLVFGSVNTPLKLGPFAQSNLLRLGITRPNRVDIEGEVVIDDNAQIFGSLETWGTVKFHKAITTGGPTCATGCDAVFNADYDLPTIEEHAAQMFANKHLPAVGPTIPLEPINISERYGNLLNELEKAHIYIAQLEQQAREREQRINTRFAKLEARIQD